MTEQKLTLSAREAAALSGIGYHTLYGLIRSGDLPAIQIGPEGRAGKILLHRAVFERWLAEGLIPIPDKRRSRPAHADGKYRTGLPKSFITEMLERQNGLCAICGDDVREKPHIDHCHETGLIRGVLCARCNFGLGWFRDNPSALVRAAEYLLKYKEAPREID